MRLLVNDDSESLDFRRRATFGLAILSMLILTPFAINNFVQQRPLLGTGALAIVLILAWNAWQIRRGRHAVWLLLLGLVPMILVFLVLAFQRQGIIGALWCYPAVLSFYMMLPERKAWIANVALLVVAIPQAWATLPLALVIRIAASLVAVSGFSIVFTRVIIAQQTRLQSLAETDPLTGLFNRKTLRGSLDAAIERHGRDGAPMTLVALDLDDFKAINDECGHDAGDDVLRRAAHLFRDSVRSVDRVFRTGGEEFLILLPETDAAAAGAFAENLRLSFAAQRFLPDRLVTTSIGVAAIARGEDRAQWMKRADDNLYRAKLEGRNRVVA
jgi:diguanylate cyclase